MEFKMRKYCLAFNLYRQTFYWSVNGTWVLPYSLSLEFKFSAK